MSTQTASLPTMRTELRGDRIRLRAVRPDDADRIFEAVCESISELSAWMPWCHSGYRLEETAQWIATQGPAWNSGAEYSFIIEDLQSGELLGGCGVHHLDRAERRANLGYWVRSSRTRQGVASTAARLLARAAIEDLGLARVEILVDVENHASQRVAAKAGAQREGIARRRLRIRDTNRDAVCFSLLSDDFAESD